jgi:glycosyltransferase involved in cell wall biosynthesis
MVAESRPSVSIITRTKDRPLLLERAIKSVLNQTYSEWIHVVVNDGGDAKSVQSLLDQYRTQYAGRLCLVTNNRSLGMEAASNVGLRSCE